MMTAGAGLLLTQADSARAVTNVYAATLLATVPLVIALAAAVVLRQARAEARTLVWRCMIVALGMIIVGRESPAHAVAWALPSQLAAPLVALGRVQIASTVAISSVARSIDALSADTDAVSVVRGMSAIYIMGIVAVLVPLLWSCIAFRVRSRQARRLEADDWRATLADARRALSLRRSVRLLISSDVRVPMTWGIIRPIVLLPVAASNWSDDRRRMVLMHELVHVKSADWGFKLAARVVCAMFWFHPGVWWLSRRLRDDCERAADDRVVAAGAKRSDYAELLVQTADELHFGEAALALSSRGGLRGRLTALLDSRRDIRPLARGWIASAVAATLLVAGPVSTVRLALSRDVLTTLMADTRWESRAYAVLGLAQRADSVAVARSAAERDPSPRVRAWARYALGQTASPIDLSPSAHER